MLDYLRAFWLNNPVRTASIIAGLIVAGLAKFGVIVDDATIAEAIALAVPVILGGELARQKVTPYVGEVGPPSDELLAQQATIPPQEAA